MKTISKILSVVLCLAMVVGFFTFGAAAESVTGTLVTDAATVKQGGTFVLVANYGGEYWAMNAEVAAKPTATKISAPSNNQVSGDLPVWTVAATGNGISLAVGANYLTHSSKTNFASGSSPYEFTLTANSNGSFQVFCESTRSSGTQRALAFQDNTANTANSYRFAPYGTTQNDDIYSFDIYFYQVSAATGGNTGSGNTGSGNTGSGNTGSGNTGSGNTGSTTATVVESPVVGTAYKLGLQQVNVNKTLFFSGAMSDKFYGTTDNAASAVDVYLETATGGYYLYFMDGTTKTYLNLEGYMSGSYQKAAVKLGTEATTVFTYDTSIKAFISEVGSDSFTLGTYGTYETISASSTYYITGDKAGDIGVSQFLACLYTSDGTGSGNTGSGNTGSGNTGSGNTGSGNTGSGNTGSGNTGSGNTGSGTTTGTYNKVTETLTSGTYVLVANNGYAPTTFASGWMNSVQPTVSGDKVTDAKGAVLTLTVNGSKVTITDSEGNVIINETGANKLANTAGATWNWKYENGAFVFFDDNTEEGQTRYLCSAKADDNKRFRAYRGPFDEPDTYGNLYYNQFTAYKLDSTSGGNTGSGNTGSGNTGSGNTGNSGSSTQKPTAPVIDTGVKQPTAGSSFKFGMYQENLKKYLYFNGKLDSKGYYLDSTENYAEAVDVTVEATTGGYYLYFMNGTTKTYIEIYVTDAGYVNMRLVETPTTVYTWNAEHKTFTAKLTVKGAEVDHFISTYKEYTTFSGSDLKYISTSFAAHLYADEPAPTADTSVISVAIAAAVLSVLGTTALVMKKKEF